MHGTTNPPEPAETESDYPAYWDFEKDGRQVAGAYVAMGSGPTAYGTKPFVTIDVAGTQRTVWLSTNILRDKFAEELKRRKARNFLLGEEIVITRAAEKKMSGNDRGYWPFTVVFLEGPELDAASLLGIDDDEMPAASEQPETGASDDDIPF
jgi:hypothetical protein